jgi:serine/threonine-protein kinase CTR1
LKNLKKRWIQVLTFAVTTARGMAWLHSRRPVVLHRDLHSNNILVTDNHECKVADFGKISRFCRDFVGLSQIQGQKYQIKSMYKRIIPPEILKGEPYTKQSDVFMYGLILHEVLISI